MITISFQILGVNLADNKQICEMSECYLLLGTNLGNREQNLQVALREIGKRAGKVIKTSAIYETEPWGFIADIPFLNQAIQLETLLLPHKLLEILQEIELKMGRIKLAGNSYASRLIDIDILFINNEIIHVENLNVPHPLLHARKFALLPLRDICPAYVHPLLGLSVAEMTENCQDQSSVVKRETGFTR